MKDLDTLYETSEQQLSGVPTESREGASAIESKTADLTKTAKLLPELRVSLTHLPMYLLIGPHLVFVFQKVEMFGRCQDILRRCEDMAKQTGVATRNTLVQLFTGLTKTWDMARQSQQLSQVQLLVLFSLSPTSHTPPPPPPHTLSPQLCQQSEELLTKQLPPVRAVLVTSGDVPLLSPSTPGSVPPVLVTPPGWPHPPPSVPYRNSPSPQTPQPQVYQTACLY